MKHRMLMAAGLIALAACAADGAVDPPRETPSPDGGDGGTIVGEPEPTDASAPPDGDADAGVELPLVCGDAGFCETRIPTSKLGLPLSLQSVWMVAPNDVWSASAEGYVLHYDGTSWATAHQENRGLFAVWATASSVWAGGEGGSLFRRSSDGTWARFETGRLGTVRAIYGTNDDDVWFAFSDETVSHFDGTTLTNHPVDIPGLRITTVFGRPGVGVYAAGYVESRTLSEESGLYDHEPHLFELSPTEVVEFNPILPMLRGFAPLSGVVTDTPNEDQRISLVMLTGNDSFGMGFHFALGSENLGTVQALGNDALFFDVSGSPLRPPHALFLPVWARNWDDIYIPAQVGAILRWNETELTSTSLKMGQDFVPRSVFGIHGNATEAWLVGDGFALKGATL